MQRSGRRPLAIALASALLWSGSAAESAAQRLAQRNVSARTHLAFEVSDAAVQPLLPDGWRISPVQAGPSRGANLILVLLDRMIIQDAEGKPIPGESSNHVAVLVVPARHAGTGAAGPMIVDGFSAKPEGVPGAYGNFVLADGRLERTLRAGPGGARENEERWSYATGDGERLEVRLRYAPATPVRSSDETRNYSSAMPTGFYRLYRSDQGVDLLHSATTGVDRVSEFGFTAAGPRLDAVFDGSERLISVVSIPWQVRQVLVP